MKRSGLGFFVLVLLVGAVVGSLAGEILGQLVPNGPLHAFFTRGVNVGIPSFSVDLPAITFSLGLMLRVNLCTLFGLALAFYVLRR
jgi:hypothetical protein